MASRKNAIDFEKALNELESLVTLMEKGDISLEDSLKTFEQGIKLSRQCQEALTSAEQRVQVLLGESAEASLKELNSSDLPEGDE